MIRRLGCALAISGTLLLSGCTSPDHPTFNSYEGGYRLDSDGGLVVWMGAGCQAVRSVTYDLVDADGTTYDSWRITSTSPDGAPLTSLALGRAPDGFRAADPLESDWRDANSHGILLRTRTDQTSAHLDVPSFLAEADERDSGEWYVPDQGWHTQAEYRDELVGGENSDIYPLCRIRG